MLTATITVKFCAGHRLLNYSGKCKHLHGHNYTVEVHVENTIEGVNQTGFVADFGDVKKAVKGWIDENWDHALVLNGKDEIGKLLLQETLNNRIFFMDGNPTAENMATFLFELLPTLLAKDLRVISVAVEETDGCYATVIA